MYGHQNLTENYADAMKPADEIFGDVISGYTRIQAIEDGVLVDVTDTAHDAGFRVPIALTAAVWADCVEWYDEDSQRQCHQDVDGRLWDVVWMLSRAARRGGEVIHFQLYRVPRGGRGIKPRLVTLKAICGPDDTGSPCVTVMFPNED